MRIGIDIRDLSIARTGARTYLDEICKAFLSLNSEHDFVFLSPQREALLGKSKFAKIINQLAFYWWKEIELPWLAWRNKCDVILCTDYVVPLFAHCPTTPVFYDASFWANPTHYNRLWRLLMNLLALPAAKKSSYVITISEFSQQEIAKYTGIPAESIIPVPIASKTSICAKFEKNRIDSILQQYGINTNFPFILYVGVLEKRKNLPRLIEAFALFKARGYFDYQLVLVGQPGPKQDLDDSVVIQQTIEHTNLGESVILVGYVPDEDLAAFYQGAMFFVFPSLREGFGIPILEAFHSNLPVIASNLSAIPEVGGDAVLYVNPFDVESIAQSMIKLASSDDLRTELIELGQKRAALFGWDKTALKLVEIFERVGSDK